MCLKYILNITCTPALYVWSTIIHVFLVETRVETRNVNDQFATDGSKLFLVLYILFEHYIFLRF